MALDYDLVVDTTSVSVGTSAVALDTSTTPARVVSFILQADDNNTAVVYVGDASVSANDSITLAASDTLSFAAIDPYGTKASRYSLDKVYLLAAAASQRVKLLKIVENRQL